MRSRLLLDFDAADLLATLRREAAHPDKGRILTATRPYPLTAVRAVALRLTKRVQPLSASREDLAHAITLSLAPRVRAPLVRRRNTSPAACRAALRGV